MGQIASVAAITGTGTAFAVSEQGVSRQLKVGDVLQKGETIRTVGDVQVELLMDDGRLLAVAPDQVLRLDENVSESDQRPTAQDSAVGAPAATADTVLQALERGTDLSTELEATAAGLGGGAGADGGSSFVQLLRIVEGVEPLAYEYSYTAPDLLPDLQSNPEALTATSLVLSADPVVLEGSPGVTYTVTLADPAATDMTVTLSNGAVIVIPAGYTTGAVLVPVQGDDVYKDGETLQATVDTVQGGGFNSITVNDANVITVVNDTIDTTPVAVGVSVLDGDVNNVVEGNELTFRFSVNQAPQSDLILNVSVGGVAQTVTIAADSLFTDVTVDTRADENYLQGSATVTGVVNSVSLTADGNFENLSIEGASATATVVDDGDVTRASISTNDVTENDAGVTFSIVLSNPPLGETTAQVQVGETTYNVAIGTDGAGTLFIPTNDPDAYKDPSSVTATVTGVTGGNYEVVSVAGATATADITDIIGEGDTTMVRVSAGNVTENDAGVTFSITLSNPPQGATTVQVQVGEAAYNVVIDAEGKGSLFVPTANPDVYVDPGSITATVTGVTGGNFEAVDFSEATATAQIADTIDTTTVSLGDVTVDEGTGMATLSASIGANPVTGSPLVLTLSNGTTITIAVGETSGTSTPFAVQGEDSYKDGESYTVSITGASGANFEALNTTDTATVAINDTVNTVTVGLSAEATEVEGANSILYTASLSGGVAKNDITVTLVNGEKITIAAGASSGTVTTPTQGDDVYLDAGVVTNSIASAVEANAGMPGALEDLQVAANTSVSTAVSDTMDPTKVTLSDVTVTEGGSFVYSASVDHAPFGSDLVITLDNNVVITIAAGMTTGQSLSQVAPVAAINGGSSSVIGIASVSGGHYELVDKSDTLTLTVNDTAPTAVADSYSEVEGQTLTVLAENGVLANDITSLDGGKFAIAGTLTGSFGGTLTLAADGSFTYNAPVRDHSDAIGDTETFTYTMRDADGTLRSSTLSVSMVDTVPTLSFTNSVGSTSASSYTGQWDETLSADVQNVLSVALSGVTVGGVGASATDFSFDTGSGSGTGHFTFTPDGSTVPKTVEFTLTLNTDGTYEMAYNATAVTITPSEFSGSVAAAGPTSTYVVSYTDTTSGTVQTANVSAAPQGVTLNLVGTDDSYVAKTIGLQVNASGSGVGIDNNLLSSYADHNGNLTVESMSYRPNAVVSDMTLFFTGTGANQFSNDAIYLTVHGSEVGETQTILLDSRTGDYIVGSDGHLTAIGGGYSGGTLASYVVPTPVGWTGHIDHVDVTAGFFTDAKGDVATSDVKVDFGFSTVSTTIIESPVKLDFTASLVDDDGSSSTAYFSAQTESGHSFVGTDGSDVITATSIDDVISGGDGSDTMAGGFGSDVFKWSLDDTGSDKITDFNLAPVAAGGDVLDLTDLLVGESSATAGSLESYLSFGENELGQTVITVDANASASGGLGQTITLENIQFEALQSYVGGLGDDAAIIAKLVDDGNLQTNM